MIASTNSGRFAITPALAVEDRRLGDAAYRVLACLGTYADRQGWCWPSTIALAQRLGITRQAVQRSLRQLAELGYIEVEARRRTDGGYDRNRYRLLFDRALFEVRNRDLDETSEPEESMQHDVASPCNMTLQTMQRGLGEGCNVDAISPTPPYIFERTHKNVREGAGTRPADPQKAVFDLGKAILGNSAGGLIRKLLRHVGDDCDRALDLLRRCERKNDPREYANAILRGDARADDVLAETERLYRDLGVS